MTDILCYTAVNQRGGGLALSLIFQNHRMSPIIIIYIFSIKRQDIPFIIYIKAIKRLKFLPVRRRDRSRGGLMNQLLPVLRRTNDYQYYVDTDAMGGSVEPMITCTT